MDGHKRPTDRPMDGQRDGHGWINIVLHKLATNSKTEIFISREMFNTTVMLLVTTSLTNKPSQSTNPCINLNLKKLIIRAIPNNVRVKANRLMLVFSCSGALPANR